MMRFRLFTTFFLTLLLTLSVSVKPRTMAQLKAIVTYQSKKDRVEITTTATGNAKRKLKAMTIPATTTKAIALFIFALTDE